MRYTVLGVIMGILFVLFLSCNMTVSGRSLRQNELELSVDRAADQTVERMKSEEYAQITQSELEAELVENILCSINSDSAIEVTIMECNMEQGILAVQVQASFQHPNGKTGTVSTEKTVLWEKHKI